jgi:excinuclease ABC subunit C
MTQHPPKPFDLKTELANLPEKPGVYRMYDATDTLIYVGKAKVLKNRVRSYFQQNAQHTAKTRVMVAQIARFDYVVTASEVEALVLEDTFIKTNQPRYNVALKKSVKYPWLALIGDPYPRLIITRRNKNMGPNVRFFGPYTNTQHIYRVLKFLRTNFPLRIRRFPLFRDRPCMNYTINLCPGPCQKKVSVAEYAQTVEQVVLFLKGHTQALTKQLTHQMLDASEAMAYEKAARIRNTITAIASMDQKQGVVINDSSLNLDVIGLAEDGWVACLVVLNIREGKVIHSKPFDVAMNDSMTAAEVFEGFVRQYYRDIADDDLPPEVVLQYPLDDGDVLAAWLAQRRRKKVVLTVQPPRAPRKDLLTLAQNNAKQALEQAKLYEATRLKNDPVKALLDLQERLGLPHYPQRMECYDISHFQGSQTVASMVVFIDGVAAPAEYRRFKIACAEGKPDDFASMHEVITRRLQHLDEWGEPDLLIIDGGKGQLSSAFEALKQNGVEAMPMVSLAKRIEEIFLPGQSDPILISHTSPMLHLMQQIRDEAHRFAITYHRTLRAKASMANPLDGVPGIGDKRKQALLQHYKTIAAMVAAHPADMAKVLGVSLRQAEQLHGAIVQTTRGDG